MTRREKAIPAVPYAEAFGVGPAEAAAMDPQQRKLLAWSAATLSAATEAAAAVGETGVYIGMATTDYGRLAADVGLNATALAATGSAFLSVAAGRGLHSSTSHLNVRTRRSHNPRKTSTHHRLITCQHSAAGATLVHFSAQPELYFVTEPLKPPSHQKVLTLSQKGDGCTPLTAGRVAFALDARGRAVMVDPWSIPEKPCLISAIEAEILRSAAKLCFQFQFAPLLRGAAIAVDTACSSGLVVGPGRHCPPRHKMTFNSTNSDSKRMSMTRRTS